MTTADNNYLQMAKDTVTKMHQIAAGAPSIFGANP